MSDTELSERRAYIGLGSNIGDREGYLRQAAERLSRHPSIRVERLSAIYETDPVGYTEQPAFLNQAAVLVTTLLPGQLFEELLDTERLLHRTRDVRWGPRTIDLDLLLYHDHTIDTPALTVPHPRMFERAFVLIPLFELAKDDPFLASRLTEQGNAQTLNGKEGVHLWKPMH